MRENERTNNGTEEKIMRRETVINDMCTRTAMDLNDTRYYVSSILDIDIPTDRVQYTMDFIKVITGYNFRVSNVKIMLKYIKAFMYFNRLHIIDIDISDSDVSPKCIYLICNITFKNKLQLRHAYVGINCYGNDMIEFMYCTIDHERDRIGNIERLKKVISDED